MVWVFFVLRSVIDSCRSYLLSRLRIDSHFCAKRTKNDYKINIEFVLKQAYNGLWRSLIINIRGDYFGCYM